MRQLLVFAVLAAVSLSLAPVAAQSPVPSGDVVELDVPRTEQTFSTEEPAAFTVTVRYNAQGSGTPIDEGGSADITISFTDVPDGWTAKAEPSAFSLPPGGERDVTITVVSGPDGAESGTLTITAEAVSQDPSNTFLPSGSAQGSVDLARDESLTRTLVEGLGGWVWFLIGGALAAVIVLAYMLAESRRRLVRVWTDVDEAIIRPGATVSIPFNLLLGGNAPDRVAVHADIGARGWEARTTTHELELVPGEEEEVSVAVTAPKRVAKGSRQVLRIVAVPGSMPQRTGVLQVVVKVEK